MSDVALTVKQKSALGFLFYKYGNGGSMSSADNHKFFQLHLQENPTAAAKLLHRITPDCLAAFNRILAEDYRELSTRQKGILEAEGKGYL